MSHPNFDTPKTTEILTQPNQICIEDIAMALSVYVHEAPLRGAEARLTRKGNKGIIRVQKKGLSKCKRRFAIGHELGHWERHKELSQLFYCTSNDLRGYTNSTPEVEANTFSAEMLIPSILIDKSIYAQDPCINYIKDMSVLFDTSLTVASIRYVEDHPENCLVLFSEKGIIKWWRKSRNSSAWIDTRIPLQKGSIAWEYFNNGEGSQSMEEMELGVWLPIKYHQENRMSVNLNCFIGEGSRY